MSFSLFPYAPPLACWAADTSICVREIDGSVSTYACNLGFTTRPQLVQFIGVGAVWVLWHEDTLFVGRDDGTFSGFRKSDSLLVRFGAWDYPFDRKTYVIGQMGAHFAYLDSRDLRTVYITNEGPVYLFHKPFSGPVYEYAYLKEYLKATPYLTIPVKGGIVDVSTAGTWVNAPSFVGRGRPLFL